MLPAMKEQQPKKPRPKGGRQCMSKSVSFHPEVLASAKERARSLRMSFSEYVVRCLQQDMESGGNFIILPEDEKRKGK